MQSMNSIEDLMSITLSELYETEQRQLRELPKFSDAVQTPELKQALQQHQQETRQHVELLDQIFRKRGEQPRDVPNPILDAMAQHAQEIIDAGGKPEVKEAALIGEAQKFDHLEMAGYGTAAAYAKHLGDRDTAAALKQILEQEKRDDARLSEIAESESNVRAAQA